MRLIGDDNICSVTHEECLDEACPPGAMCQLNEGLVRDVTSLVGTIEHRSSMNDTVDVYRKPQYTFTQFSSDAEPQHLDQDGRKVRPVEVTVKFWTAIWCVLSLFHLNPGVWEDAEGHWRCKRCNRRVRMWSDNHASK